MGAGSLLAGSTRREEASCRRFFGGGGGGGAVPGPQAAGAAWSACSQEMLHGLG